MFHASTRLRVWGCCPSSVSGCGKVQGGAPGSVGGRFWVRVRFRAVLGEDWEGLGDFWKIIGGCP